jgi:hypothetical protein
MTDLLTALGAGDVAARLPAIPALADVHVEWDANANGALPIVAAEPGRIG